MDRKLADAQHEAAHVVVGVSLGLRLKQSRVFRAGDEYGETEWRGYKWPNEAALLMFAAGVAWERRVGDLVWASDDLKVLRDIGVTGSRLTACERAAWALLESRAGVHARVTRALLDGDLDDRSVKALFRPKT
jgi:hypothetical protein